jgi:hypothetical protein
VAPERGSQAAESRKSAAQARGNQIDDARGLSRSRSGFPAICTALRGCQARGQRWAPPQSAGEGRASIAEATAMLLHDPQGHRPGSGAGRVWRAVREEAWEIVWLVAAVVALSMASVMLAVALAGA